MGIMTTAELLAERVRQLPEDLACEVLDFVEFLSLKRQKIADDAWDNQIQADAESGKLDAIFAADIQAYEAGQCQRI
ncbi:MAG: hypothetical protein RL122_1669 [Pseudomonadota bacterium]|jgi:hypothetical protein|uniref:DUF2281 domain-containing protein n=1 Tax=Thiothrix fructosivorans TaxID=111770 RepID=A0A8B0SHR7_9GAMM|nr:DUF2281 domain-containing protein [Thiothrix fructosivorans]MBO0613680.1 DUF2281 domain-containing protein [Thiothrix fructosivorans]QTX10906.1 DUF2281 domain-containing protein [Thiothrix fructosivorans]